MRRILTIAVLLGACTVAQAQDSWLNVLRSDVRTQVAALIEVAMEFSDAESEAFWPLYREYELEQSKLADARIEMLKEYAQNYASMSDEKADELVKTAQDLLKKRQNLNRDFQKKIRKELSGVRAARYWQVHNQIQTLIDLQIQSELPLIQEAIEASDSGNDGME